MEQKVLYTRQRKAHAWSEILYGIIADTDATPNDCAEYTSRYVSIDFYHDLYHNIYRDSLPDKEIHLINLQYIHSEHHISVGKIRAVFAQNVTKYGLKIDCSTLNF